MKIGFTLLCSLVLLRVSAQNNNSPYSLMGIGDLEDGFMNRTTGLGSTGISYRNNRSLITNNPAALSALDNQWFCGELGVKGKFVTYSGTPVSPTAKTSSDITFKHFVLGTKIFKHWGSAAGLTPYSSENFQYNGEKLLGYQGAQIPYYNEGYGGLNRVFWANGYEFFHHLSLGITSSYIFGSINNKSILQGPTGSAIYLSKNEQTFYSNFYFDYGLQYYGALSKHWDFSIGLVYANQGWMNTDHYITVLNIDSMTLRTKEDIGTYTIPTSYGAGLSITHNKKYTFLADYRFQNWGINHSNSSGFVYENSQRASVGFEISHKKIFYNTVFETNYFQFGAYYNKSYVVVNGTPIEDMGLTAGMGLSSMRTRTFELGLNVVLQYGIRGTTENNLIKENYGTISFIFSFRDFWYTKGRRFD